MNKVYLHGKMRKKYGPCFELSIKNPAEAVHALGLMMPEFKEDIRKGSWRIIRGPMKGGRALGPYEIGINLPGEMHLVAAPVGGKKMGGAKIILGVFLIAAAVFFAPAAAGAGATTAGAEAGGAAAGATAAGVHGAAAGGMAATAFTMPIFGSITYSQIAMFGASMMMTGISQLLSPTPKSHSSSAADTKPSYLFNGQIGAADQGGAVPLIIGRMRVPGTVISLGFDTNDI